MREKLYFETEQVQQNALYPPLVQNLCLHRMGTTDLS